MSSRCRGTSHTLPGVGREVHVRARASGVEVTPSVGSVGVCPSGGWTDGMETPIAVTDTDVATRLPFSRVRDVAIVFHVYDEPETYP